MKQNLYLFIFGVMTLGFFSCQAPGGNSPGSEYMPDMAHSIAYEANHYQYYYNNTWGGEEEYHQFAQPRKPVAGTIPRGVSKISGDNTGITIPPAVGASVYPYSDNEEDRTRAINEIIKNPYPITDAGLVKGKELYTIYCATCHGDKGDGAGYLVRDDGGVYPAQPANFLLEEHLNASNGRYYHSIMHGRNLMGSYKDKLNTEERWQVIHYIRSLQAKELKKEYNQMVNTLNDIDIPAGEMAEALDSDEGDNMEALIEDQGHDDHGDHSEDNH
jgi:mono/diheme cytochrome c family protein